MIVIGISPCNQERKLDWILGAGGWEISIVVADKAVLLKVSVTDRVTL